MSKDNKQITIDSIQYIGNITVTIKQHNKIISKQTYHNQGGAALFNFLSNCIISDNYKAADAPRFIKLFTFLDNTISTGVPPTSGIITDSKPICASVYYNASDIILEDNSASAYLHFTIPCSAISNSGDGNGGSGTVKIYQAGLYSANYAHNQYKTSYSAAFNFLNGGQWAPIAVSSANGDYNIFIDWKLSFINNTNTEQNN